MTTEQIVIELHRIAHEKGLLEELRTIYHDAATKIDALMGWDNLDRCEKIVRDYKIGCITHREAIQQLGTLGYDDDEITRMF